MPGCLVRSWCVFDAIFLSPSILFDLFISFYSRLLYFSCFPQQNCKRFAIGTIHDFVTRAACFRCLIFFDLEVRTATDWFEAVARVFCCSISWSLKFVSFAQAQCPATDDTDLDVDAQINRLEEARWAIEKSFLLAWSSKSIQCTYRTSQIEQSNELWRHVRDIDWLFV